MDGEERDRPVFVDPSGRRGRYVRAACWLVASLGTTYIVLVLLALVVPAGLARLTVPGLGPLLPGPAAPTLHDASGQVRRPSQLLPSPTARSGSRAAAPGRSSLPVARPAGPLPSPGRPATPSSGPAPRPSNVPAATASPGVAPGRHGNPPGRTPTPAPSGPTPTAGPSATASPNPTPTPKPRPSHKPRG